MVSFSCDYCQDVQTRKRVDSHFFRCRTRSVSCIDCGAQFDARSVKSHTSCISEAEKYEGGARGVRKSSNSYCAICNLAIPGLVAAEQHYNSKKHKKNERAANLKRMGVNGGEKPTTENVTVGGEAAPTVTENRREIPTRDCVPPNERAAYNGMSEERAEAAQKATSLHVGEDSEGGARASKVERLKVKRSMKRLLKQEPGQRMRRRKLVAAVAARHRTVDAATVGEEVRHLVSKSRRFEESQNDIVLRPKKREA